MRKREKALIFFKHIEKHLKEMEEEYEIEIRGYSIRKKLKVMCKICSKTIDEIVEEEK